MASVAPASEQLPLNPGEDFEIDISKSNHVVESWKYHRVTLVCAIKLESSAPTPTFKWINMFSNKEIKRGKHKDTRDESVLRLSTKKEKDFGTYLCIVENDSTKKTHEIDIKRLREPTMPQNIRYELHSIQDKAHLKVRVMWDIPESTGGTPITGYIVKRKTRAGSWRNARRLDTPAQKRAMLIKIKERKRYAVRIIAVNKVGWSEPTSIVLEETIPEHSPEPPRPQPTAKPETSKQEPETEPSSSTTGEGEASQQGQVAAQVQKPETSILAPFNKDNIDVLFGLENEEPEDWELVSRSEDADAEVWRKEDTKPSLFKINLSFTETKFEQVVELVTNWEKRRQWDKSLASLDIADASGSIKTVQLILDMPTCYNKRELLINTADISMTNKGEPCHVSLWQETTHADIPPPKNCCKCCYCCCCDTLVRANLLLSGIIIRPESEDAKSVRVTMLIHTNFNGCCAKRAATKYFKQASMQWLEMLKAECSKSSANEPSGTDTNPEVKAEA